MNWTDAWKTFTRFNSRLVRLAEYDCLSQKFHQLRFNSRLVRLAANAPLS